MKKYLPIPIFCLIAVLWLGRVYDVLRWKDTHGDYLSSITQLDELPKDTVDLAFVGSSHVYAGIYPSYFWEDKGISCFNTSISGMDRDSAVHYVKHLFKTQSPKLVVVDVYCLTYEKHAQIGNVYRNLLSFPLSKDSLTQLDSYAEKDESVSENKTDYITRWPIIHTRYRELTRRDFVTDAPNFFGKGEYLNWEGRTADPAQLTEADAAAKLSADHEAWLKELKSICEAQGSTLALMALPFDTYEGDQEKMDATAVWAEENGVRFWDFNRLISESGLDYETDFFDSSHLNALGAKKAAAFLEEEIAVFCPLADHRGQAGYESWDLDLKYFYQREKDDRLAAETELSEYTALLASSENYCAVISIEGGCSGEEFEALRSLGVDPAQTGKWLWKDGALSKIAENDPAMDEITIDADEYSTFRIRYLGDFAAGNVMLDRSDCSNTAAGCRIAVYDSFLHRVVSIREFLSDSSNEFIYFKF